MVSSRQERSSDEEVAAVADQAFSAIDLERTTKTRKTAMQTRPSISRKQQTPQRLENRDDRAACSGLRRRTERYAMGLGTARQD